MSYQPKGIKKIYHQTRRFLAKNWLKLWKPTQIAITGSQGKTNTTQILYQILKEIAPTVVTDINLDTNFNVPITALKVRPWTKFAVFELGIDHPCEMDKHLEIVNPHISVITGLSTVHTDKEHFGSIKKYHLEKRKIIEKLTKNDFAILNYDDENVRKMAGFTKAKVIFYGSDKNHCQFYFDKNSIKVSFEGTSFKLNSTDLNRPQLVSTKLIGLHHPYNITAVYAILKILFPKKTDLNSIFLKKVSELKSLRGRMNIEKGPKQTIILNDSLRANPKSTDEGIKTFYSIKYNQGKKIAILGVMGELYDPILEHKKTAKTLLQYPPDIVIGVGDYRKYTIDQLIKLGFPKNKAFFAKDVFQAAEILKKLIKPGDFLYLKSSLLRNLWRIVKILNGEKVCCDNELCPYEHCKF
ncbi:MAG: Mur ligase family protein [Microgenomates group bacterium]